MAKLDKSMLYVGTNYHPHDWSEDAWERDLNLMKAASMNVVRLGHLCWDSFEPKDGVFEFEWMDKVMAMCEKRDIFVFLDIPTRPAPTWLHKKYPSIDIADKNGLRQNAHTRYMEDVGDPHFQKYAYRLAKTMAKRYKDHPALLAFGLCNELGSGFSSYSETARMRFCKWLKNKYGSVENINDAWAGQRWSRKVTDFESIAFPIGGEANGAPERHLDMKRFFSDEIISYLQSFKNAVKSEAADIAISTNHWAENTQVGFDYQKCYRALFDFSGQGFYPGTNPELEESIMGACFFIDHRMGELQVPSWNLEFQTGSFGGYCCPKNVMRMYAYLTYVHGAQAVCAWTWRSMLGGEEQYLFGLIDHDGEPTIKYDEFKQIAEEAKMLVQTNIFPSLRKAKVAIAYSYESLVVSEKNKDYYTVPYISHIMQVYNAFFRANVDCNIINLNEITEDYDTVLIPGHALMSENMAKSIKHLLYNGTTVIMTAFSAKVDENSKVFSTSLPGLLTDVFGVKVRGFDRSFTHVAVMNEGCLEKPKISLKRDDTKIILNDKELSAQIDYHEYLELTTADSIGYYLNCNNKNPTAVTCNRYGQGKAIYVGIPAEEEIIRELIETQSHVLIPQNLPHGIVYRQLNSGYSIYINMSSSEKVIPVSGYGVLSGVHYNDNLTLPAYQVDIIKTT